MKKRRSGVSLLILGLLVLALVAAVPAFASPSTIIKWADPLPVPPVAKETYNPAYSTWADYYEITMEASQHTFNAGLGPATVWTYGQPGQDPVLLGPTIVAKSGRPVIVKYINELPTDPDDFPLKDSIDTTLPGSEVPTGAAIPHLHGGHTAARYDGTPMQWWTADGVKGEDYQTDTFTYVNDQPASMLWYHDHTMGSTRFKPYIGLAAAYLLFDDVDNGKTINGQRVPSGYGKYHLPIVLQDKDFNDDGTISYPTQGISPVHPIWVPEFFGDTPVVNGKAYPYLDVQPRRYRLRLLDGSQARFYNLSFDVSGQSADLPIWVIGSEQGLLPKPVKMSNLLIAPGERFDVIVDFSKLPLGSTVTMGNDANEPYPDGDPTRITDMMRINVSKTVPANDPDRSIPPAQLNLMPVPRLVASQGLPPRDIVLKETMVESYPDDAGATEMVPSEVLLNGLHYMDPTTDFVKAGTTETWRWINLTVDAHPMHPHLVASQLVNRQKIDVDGYTTAWQAYLDSGRQASLKPRLEDYLIGSPIPPAPEEMGYKDTFKAYPGMVTRTRAKFTLPWTSQQDYDPATRSYGSWVFHCHILEHEENDMMRPFEVVR